MIYDRIKTLCDEKGLSIRKLEQQAELGNGAVSKWKDRTPTVDNLNRVAKVLGTTVESLLE